MCCDALVAQTEERLSRKEEVDGATPSEGSKPKVPRYCLCGTRLNSHAGNRKKCWPCIAHEYGFIHGKLLNMSVRKRNRSR